MTCYRIQRDKTLNPFTKNFAWHIPYTLNLDKMQSALNVLLGEHNFSAFKAASDTKMNPVRTIYSTEILQENIFNADILTIKIHASGFLYHMARNIVAATVAVGRERLSLQDFKKYFQLQNRNLMPATAPANGLCLQNVFYKNFILEE